ncbi:ORF157 [Leucania separata nucleopolyhedrovirus]|uniref:ORF157 n=1 Tax=Leucania separata nucleopolyhedrovirus TaxID=1307956 RepID=Q0IKW2_NPVLS|nr:ORF157 [Leucania separata nucleopolyhedrovirus]AAR28921.1 ORF157 [Leucania separata nucleopolyhedrovirus]
MEYFLSFDLGDAFDPTWLLVQFNFTVTTNRIDRKRLCNSCFLLHQPAYVMRRGRASITSDVMEIYGCGRSSTRVFEAIGIILTPSSFNLASSLVCYNIYFNGFSYVSAVFVEEAVRNEKYNMFE